MREETAPIVDEAIEVLGEDAFLSLDMEASSGVVTIGGTADRKTTRNLAIRIATQVPGVLEVVDELDWQWDDSNIKPVRNPRNPHEVGRDPWAVGPLVKDGSYGSWVKDGS
ncbi:MAG TPA: BON domain-containing protein [Actinomycetota bacterium]|nr:BON domain-containing protein [Actinomycetota bacterium]